MSVKNNYLFEAKSEQLIRNFDQNTKCSDVDDLMQKLREFYSGTSISVEFRKQDGIRQIVFLDVPESPIEAIENSSANWKYLTQAV